MNLRRLLHRRESDLPPLSLEEWAPLAAALRTLPDIAPPRPLRFVFPPVAQPLRQGWRQGWAFPRPLAGALAVLLIVALAGPSFLSSLNSAATPTREAGDNALAPAGRDDGLDFSAGAIVTSPTVDKPKALDACDRTPLTTSSPRPQASPRPTPTASAGPTAPIPAPTCDPGS